MTTTPPPLPSPRGGRWKRRLLALTLFLAGVVCGVGLTVIVAVNRLQHAIQHPEQAPDRIAKVLTRRLDLTPAQAADVRAALERHQQKLQAIRHEVWPRVREELDATRNDIAAVLDEKQRSHLDEMYDTVVTHWLPPEAAAASTTPASQSARTADSADPHTPPRAE